MKKMLLAALLGLGLALVSGQRAEAWSKFNFGVGLNVKYEGGGNSVLWGLFHGEQPPMGVGFGEPGEGGHGIVTDGGVSLAPEAVLPSPAPQNLPQNLMPRADAQPVSYRPQPKPQRQEPTEEEPFYAPSYWYGR
jgi:hypothetical protein